MADTHPFSNMAASGIHTKALHLAKEYLSKDTRILIAGAGEGGLEYQLLKMEPDADAITVRDINPEQYKIDEIECQFCDLNGRIPFDDASFDVCFSLLRGVPEAGYSFVHFERKEPQ